MEPKRAKTSKQSTDDNEKDAILADLRAKVQKQQETIKQQELLISTITKETQLQEKVIAAEDTAYATRNEHIETRASIQAANARMITIYNGKIALFRQKIEVHKRVNETRSQMYQDLKNRMERPSEKEAMELLKTISAEQMENIARLQKVLEEKENENQ